jgi:hypothetical protein
LLPRRPYRDAALFHGGLAVLIVVVGWLTGAKLGKSVVIAVAYFVAATLWSWWQFQRRARRLAATAEKP